MDFYKHFGQGAKARRSQRSEHGEFYDVRNNRPVHSRGHSPEWAKGANARKHLQTSNGAKQNWLRGLPPRPSHPTSNHYMPVHGQSQTKSTQMHPPNYPQSTAGPMPYRAGDEMWNGNLDPYGYSRRSECAASPPRSIHNKGGTLLRQRTIPPSSPGHSLRNGVDSCTERNIHNPTAEGGAPSPAPQNANPAKGALRVTRVDAWTRFLAYEGCFQVCLRAVGNNQPDAQVFLAEGCNALKSSLQVDEMLLSTAGVLGGEEYNSTPIIMWTDGMQQSGQLRDQSSGALPQVPPQPSVTWNPSLEVVSQEIPALRIQFQGFSAGTKKGVLQKWKKKAALRQGQAESLCIYHAETGQYFHVFLDDNRQYSTASHGGELIIDPSHIDSVVGVHLFEGNDCIASGRLPLHTLLNRDLAHHGTSLQHPSSPTYHTPGSRNLFDIEAMGCMPFLRSSQQQRGHTTNGKHKLTKAGCCLDENSCAIPVEIIHTKDGMLSGTVLISVEETCQQGLTHEPASPPPRPITPPTEAMVKEAAAKANIRVSSYMAYDFLLEAAMHQQGCCSRKLKVDGPWKWLLEEFAGLYSLRSAYTNLSHLKWIMRSDVQTCTATCLELILEEYTYLLQEKDEMGLHEQDAATMCRLAKDIKDLLAKVFENYYALSELSESGIVEGSMQQQECPPAVLEPAIILLARLSNNHNPSDQAWLRDRFKAAARKKYHRLQCSCYEETCQATGRDGPVDYCSGPQSNGRAPPSCSGYPQIQYPQPPPPHPSEAGQLQQYKKIEALAMALRNDLDFDRKIHESSILPPFLNLPLVTTEVFCLEFSERLHATLAQNPPQNPTPEAIDMVVGVGRLQEYLVRYQLMPTRDNQPYLDASTLFGEFVKNWISTVEMQMIGRCQSLEERTKANENIRWGAQGDSQEAQFGNISPLAAEMLKLMEDQMHKFERITIYWHSLGPHLERTTCSVVRAVVGAVSRYYGLDFTSSTNNNTERGPAYGVQSGRPMTPNMSPLTTLSHMPKSPLNRPQNNWNGLGQWQPHAVIGHKRDSGRPAPDLSNNAAILLNSLRRLLSDVPEFEQTLKKWCGFKEGHENTSTIETDCTFNDGTLPQAVGAQFAQLVKELRTEYSNATVYCCGVMAKSIMSNPANMIPNILHHSRGGVPGTLDVKQKIQPLLSTLEHTVLGVQPVLDSRVFVTLARGLWEHISEDLYTFVQNLQEGHHHKGAWRSRQYAQKVLISLNTWFRDMLTRCMEHHITEKDLELPLHANHAQKLLAENSSMANMQYTVY